MTHSELREGFEYEFSALDPVGSPHIDSPSVAIYETLLRKGTGGKPLPGLASSWTTADDGLSWTFTIRQAARFHSGELCDAAAVVAALNDCRWGGNKERQLWYWDAVDEVTAVDPATVKITLRHPYPRLPTLLWGTHTAIHNEGLRREHPGEYGFSIVDGTGPYRLVTWSKDELVVEGTSADETPRIITWVALPSEDERRTAAHSSQVSVLRAPPLGLWEELGGVQGDWEYMEAPQDSNAYLALNFQSVEFDFHREDLRRAVSLAIDRSKLVAEAFGGRATPTIGPVPPHDPYYRAGDPAEAGGADIAAADELLVKLGWLRGTKRIRERNGLELAFECVTQDSPDFHRMATCLENDLRVAGIRIGFRFVPPFEAFYAACEAGPQAILSKWLWQDPLEAIIGFTSSSCDGSPNWQHASVPRLDRAYDAWLHAETVEELELCARIVQQVFVETLPYIPLLTPNDSWLVHKDEQHFVPVTVGLYPEYGSLARSHALGGLE